MVALIQVQAFVLERGKFIQHRHRRLWLYLGLLHPLSVGVTEPTVAQLLLHCVEHGVRVTVQGDVHVVLELVRQRLAWRGIVAFLADHGDERAGLIDGVDLALVLLGEHQPVSVRAEPVGLQRPVGDSVVVGVLHLFEDAPTEGAQW